jgi:hypothetical protein
MSGSQDNYFFFQSLVSPVVAIRRWLPRCGGSAVKFSALQLSERWRSPEASWRAWFDAFTARDAEEEDAESVRPAGSKVDAGEVLSLKRLDVKGQLEDDATEAVDVERTVVALACVGSNRHGVTLQCNRQSEVTRLGGIFRNQLGGLAPGG